jgi:hypothetical protein
MNNLRCPQCGLSHIKRNGSTHYGKQNSRCKDSDRQFVEDSQHIGEEVKDLIKFLLLERLSLRGISRVTGVSLTWLLDFIAEGYAESPDDLSQPYICSTTLSFTRKAPPGLKMGVPSVSGRGAGRDPQEACGSSQDSSMQGHGLTPPCRKHMI